MIITSFLPLPVWFFNGPWIFHPVTAFLSLSKVIGQLCATTWLFDPMPNVLRKAVIPKLVPFLESLINTSLPSGYVPLQFQMAVVTKQTENTMLKYLWESELNL